MSRAYIKKAITTLQIRFGMSHCIIVLLSVEPVPVLEPEIYLPEEN